MKLYAPLPFVVVVPVPAPESVTVTPEAGFAHVERPVAVKVVEDRARDRRVVVVVLDRAESGAVCERRVRRAGQVDVERLVRLRRRVAADGDRDRSWSRRQAGRSASRTSVT